LSTMAAFSAGVSTEMPTSVALRLVNSSYCRAKLTSCPLQYGHQSPR